MLRYFNSFVITVFLLLLSFSECTFANKPLPNLQSVISEKTQLVKVGVHISPPFVMRDEDQFTGMAIDLWGLVAKNINFGTIYIEYNTVQELIDAATIGEIDVAVTNLTITKERAKDITLTHPWFDSGLRVMTSEDQKTGFFQIIKGLNDSGYLRVYFWIAAMILFSSVILTSYDRYFDKEFPSTWRDGFAESFYTVMSLVSTGRMPVRKNYLGWVGRISQGLWMFCGLALLAYITSSVTSVMTTISLTNQINSLADISNHRVGVFTGSIAEKYAREKRLNVGLYVNVDKAVKALNSGEIQAIIADAEVLEYYDHTYPEAKVKVVGPIFDPNKYGFGVNPQTSLIRVINIEVIGLHESGKIAEIKKKYFGKEQ